MKTLIVDKDQSELHYQGNSLNIYYQGKHVNSVPVKQLERIIVSPHVIIKAGVLGVVAEQRVSLMVLNARLPDRTATLSGSAHGDTQRRLWQYQCVNQHNFCLQLANRLVQLKLHRQQVLLQQSLLKRPELRHPLTQAINQLHSAITDLSDNPANAKRCGRRGSKSLF